MDTQLFSANTSDPYCVVKLWPEEWRTGTVRSNLNPVWEDETHDFFIYSPKQRIVIEMNDEVRTHAQIHACMYAMHAMPCTNACTHECLHTRMHACTDICTPLQRHTCARAHAHAHVRMHVQARSHAHILLFFLSVSNIPANRKYCIQPSEYTIPALSSRGTISLACTHACRRTCMHARVMCAHMHTGPNKLGFHGRHLALGFELGRGPGKAIWICTHDMSRHVCIFASSFAAYSREWTNLLRNAGTAIEF